MKLSHNNPMNICGVPFTEITVHHDSYGIKDLSVVPCCGAWLKTSSTSYPFPIEEGKDHTIDVLGAWNSDKYKEFRKSILDRTYRYCKKDTCPHWFEGKLPEPPPEALPYIEKGETHLDYPPILARVCIDKACNLNCPSCRSIKKTESEIYTEERFLSFFTCGIKQIYLNGSGELFVNKSMLKVLRKFSSKEYPHIEAFHIITNGTAFNRTNWYSLSPDFIRLLREVIVSVDSPHKETYEKLRVGGNFDITLKNLEFIAGLRRDNLIKKLILTDVLQKANIHEVADFVRFAHSLNADMVNFNKIEHWWSKDTAYFFNSMALPENWDKTYKTPVEEAVRLLKEYKIGLISNVVSLGD